MTALSSEDKQRIVHLAELRDRTNAELCAIEDGTLPYIKSRPQGVTAVDLAEKLGLTLSNANNRLTKLTRVGILKRQQVPGNGKRGGRKFLYLLVDRT